MIDFIIQRKGAILFIKQGDTNYDPACNMWVINVYLFGGIAEIIIK
jgi:hypothetical protein